MHSKAIVRYMLYTKEAKLDGTLSGTSGFAEQFSAKGLRDERGRSLRDFDGEQRLFKYPCSYLIYSESFQTHPGILKQVVYQRLHTVLTQNELDEDFPHLSIADKKAIYEILKATYPQLFDMWNLEP